MTGDGDDAVGLTGDVVGVGVEDSVVVEIEAGEDGGSVGIVGEEGGGLKLVGGVVVDVDGVPGGYRAVDVVLGKLGQYVTTEGWLFGTEGASKGIGVGDVPLWGIDAKGACVGFGP